MGCASSKTIDVATDVYRLPPSSFAVFDINAIKEPWLMEEDEPEEHEEKQKYVPVPPPILEKLELESEGPKSWDEVRKALEDLKPGLTNPTPPVPNPDTPAQASEPAEKQASSAPPHPKWRSFSFHTLNELDAKGTSKPATETTKTKSWQMELKKKESRVGLVPPPDFSNYKPVTQNLFIIKDKLEREKEGKAPPRWDPLNDYPEKCPPSGSDIVVLYTTSLGGVRRTYEDCNRVRAILENRHVIFDERDVALHGGFLNELKELLGEGFSVPRLFVKGRYIGGVDEVVGLNETGRLGRLMSWARVERGVGRQECGGCGGARFVPCLECGGSCKIVGEKGEKERCLKCNENGLIECPACV